jgi:hypothetical protein
VFGENRGSAVAYDLPSLVLGTALGSLPGGTELTILCTITGDSVTRLDDSTISSPLWNFVTDGVDSAFIPDVYLYTGSAQATMPSC